jgi:beta-glucosidase
LGENADVDDVRLTPAQRKLVRDVHATGTSIVLVLLHGHPQAILWESENIPAILDGFYLGQETGRALADVLFGKVNPGGKLPTAYPRSTGQIPVLYNALWWSGPKMYNGNGQPAAPIYPFGFGLSYTTFSFSNLKVTPDQIPVGGRAIASVTVTNTGDREGDEVVQLYMTDDYASIVRPARELKGFRRITLKPGERRTVEFPLTFEELKFWKDDGWIVEPGTFQVWMGNCSVCMSRVTLTVTG